MLLSLLAKQVCVPIGEAGSDCSTYVGNPWGFLDLAHGELLFAPTIAMAPVAILGLVVRWRRSRDVERHQLRWFGWSIVVAFSSFVTSFDFVGLSEWMTDLATALGLTLVVLAIAVAVTRYRLYEIDRIISRTVSYAMVAALLVLVFAAGVVLVPNALPGLESNPILVAAATLAVAALFNPLRRLVQTWVDRRFNRSKYDAEQVIEGFAGSLRDRIDGEGVVTGWVGVVSETMQPRGVGVWVKS